MHKISWIAMLLVITGVIIAIDVYFVETHYIGATARFLWNALVFALQSLARSLEASLALLFRRRATRILTGIFSAIGLMYVSHIILTDSQVRKAYGWREKVRLGARIVATRLRSEWIDLHFVLKCLIVVAAISAQVYFLPSIAAWFVLFPIAFLVPPLLWLWRTVSGWVADTFFGGWYWRKLGRTHRTAMNFMRAIPIIREVRGAWRIARMRYLTAWRMWRYESCYRIAKDERRRISLFEPLRLWWLGELDRYIGRPLLAGHQAWPETTYVPPVLWYDHESPSSQLIRRILGAGAIAVIVTARSSGRR